MPTQFGRINLKMEMSGKKVKVRIDGDGKLFGSFYRREVKILLVSPVKDKFVALYVNGRKVDRFSGDRIRIEALPASVEIVYK